ncbi:hypothetical protein [Sphingobium fluviale]|uniref:Uncharacterized protein n=1 Tax=Sphingobium fluviale TaxID=2506423 RepID=A0A4Q1KHG8_9SPHN|nr:hypothetical protein [Sphingobium fluviale]RXR28962.1 hypothetical protein EQG66_07745 [Sphingobium fluviale]
MAHLIILDTATGAVHQFGEFPLSEMRYQDLAGKIWFEFPASGITREIVNGSTVLSLDLTLLRPALYARIDAEAEAFCKDFVTPGETQMVRYQRKEAQARAYLADSNASVPMLEAEAAATGVIVATLAATVVAIADAWGGIMDVVEGARIGAKKAVLDAATAPEAVLAAQVDWQALVP